MSKNIINLIIFLFSFICLSQENTKIDSLGAEVEILNTKIEELKGEIQTEILKSGYKIKADKNYSFSELLVKDKKYGKIIDTLNIGEEIIILDKEIGVYKIKYKGKVGYVSTIDLKIDGNSSLKHLEYKYTRSSSSRSSESSSSNSTYVKGHYRKTKSGKRVYVRGHRRKN